jgi:hypothetical protein
MMRAPESRMDILSTDEIDSINSNSKLVEKYEAEIDRESAYEILTKKIEEISVEAEEAEEEKQEKQENKEPGMLETVGKSVTKIVTSASFIRGAFSVLMKVLKSRK